jgi:hypothetical protein
MTTMFSKCRCGHLRDDHKRLALIRAWMECLKGDCDCEGFEPEEDIVPELELGRSE